MTDARFHRIAVLADVTPEELAEVFAGVSRDRAARRHVRWAIWWCKTDDAKRGRAGLWPLALVTAT